MLHPYKTARFMPAISQRLAARIRGSTPSSAGGTQGQDAPPKDGTRGIRARALQGVSDSVPNIGTPELYFKASDTSSEDQQDFHR